MLVQRTMLRMLSGGGLLALAAFLLPGVPARAQQPSADGIRWRVVAEDDAVKARLQDAEIDKLTAELAKKKAEIAALEAKLKALQGGKPGAGATEKPGVIVLQFGGDKGGPAKPGEQPKIVLELKDLQFQVDRVQSPERPLVIEVTVDGKKKLIELPPGSRVIDPARVPPPAPVPPRETKPRDGVVPPPAVRETKPREGAMVPPPPVEEPRRVRAGAPAGPSDTDKRVGELEKKMTDLLRELEGLRKDLKAAPPKPPVRYIPLPEGDERKDSPRK